MSVLAVSFAALLDAPAPLVERLGFACGVTALLTVAAARCRGPVRTHLSAESLLIALSLVTLSLAITAGSIAALPPPLFTVNLLPFRHLGVVLVAQLLALTALVTWGMLAPPGKGSLVAVALACVVVHATLNGELHGLLGTARVPLLFGATVLAAVAALASGRPLRTPPALLAAATAIFVCAAGLASVAGFDPHEGFVRMAALVNWVVVAALLIGALEGRREVRGLIALLLAIAGAMAAASLAAAVSVVATFGPASLLGIQLGMARTNANGAGLCAGVSLVLCVGAADSWRRRPRTRALLMIVTPLLVGALVLSYSKAAACGFAAGLAMLILGRQAERRERRRPRARITPALAIAATLAVGVILGSLFQRDPNPGIASRLILWKQALRTIEIRPILGIGLGDAFSPEYFGLMDRAEFLSVRGWFTHTHAHDLFLALGVATGLVGLAAFCALSFFGACHLARSIKTCPRVSRSLGLTLAAALVAWWVDHLAVLVLSERSLVGETFWVLLALAIVVVRNTGNHLSEIRPPPFAAALILAFVSLLAVVRPALSERLRVRGEAGFSSGQVRAARQFFGVAARLSPTDAALEDRWGVLEGDLIHAAAHWRRAAALRPKYAPYQDRLGWLAWLEGDRRSARQYFREAIRLDPEGISAGPYQAHLAALTFHEGDRAGALSLLQESFLKDDERFISPPDWGLATGDSDFSFSRAYAPGATGGGGFALREAILRHLGRPGSASDLGFSADSIRLEEFSLPLFTRSPMSERDHRALLRLMEIYRRMGLADKTSRIADVLRARLPPNDSTIFWMSARLLAEQRRFSEAVAPVERLVAMNEQPELRRMLAITLAEAGDSQAAAAQARRLIGDPAGLGALSPLAGAPWLELSNALERAGALPEALGAAERAAFTNADGTSYMASTVAAQRIRLALSGQWDPGASLHAASPLPPLN